MRIAQAPSTSDSTVQTRVFATRGGKTVSRMRIFPACSSGSRRQEVGSIFVFAQENSIRFRPLRRVSVRSSRTRVRSTEL